MRTIVVLLIGAVAFASGIMLGFKLDSDEAGTSPATSTSGLPAAVEHTRAELLAAAESRDYEALAELVPATGFEYTFGGPVEGGPVAYWQELEQTTNERPIEALAAILEDAIRAVAWLLRLAVDVHGGERRRPLGARARAARAAGCSERALPAGAGYFGWRTGIAPDGTWTFFVAGD